MAVHFSAEEVVAIQASLRLVRSELDSITYVLNENQARVQQLWGYFELRLREMDRKQVCCGFIAHAELTRNIQYDTTPQTPATATVPKRPWQDNAPASVASGSTTQSKKKDGKQ